METGETFHSRKKLKYTTLPEITSSVLKARKNNTPEETISRFLSQRGYTTQSFTKAVNNQTAKEEVKPVKEQEQGGGFWDTVTDGLEYFNKAGDSFLMGRTFGLTVPARAAGRYAKSNLVDEEPISFSGAVDSVQAEDKQWRGENPNMAMGTEIAGAMAGGMDIVPKAGIMAPVAGQGKMNLVKGATSLGAAGAIEGGGIAAAKDENIGKGTILGSIAGAGGAILMPAAKWITKKLFDPVMKKLGKTPKKDLTQAEIEGEQMLEEVDMKDGLTVIQKEMKLAEYKKLGLGDEVMEVDLLGKKGQNLAGTIMRQGDKIPAAAEKSLVERAGRVRQNIYDFLQDATGGTRGSMKKAGDTFKAAAKEESASVYDAAFYVKGKSGGTMRKVSDTGLNKLFKMPEFKSAYKRAVKIAANDKPPVILPPIPRGGFKEGHQFPVYALDKVKKAINTKFGRGFLSPDSNVTAMSSSMRAHNNDMLDIIGKFNDEYKQAREIYAGSMEFKDANELGQKLFDSGDSFDKAYEYSTKLKTESEKREFRNAAFNVLAKKIESSSVNPKGIAQFFMSKENMRKLEILIPDPEKRGIFLRQNELLSGFVDVKNKIVGGSQTAEKLAADAAEEEMNQGLRAVSNVMNRNPAGLALQAQELGSGARRAGRLDEAGSKMYQQTSPKIQADHESSLITNKLLKNQMRGKSLLSGATTGGGSSLINSLLQ